MAPRLSEATAVSVCAPSASRTETLYGLVASLPSDTAPSKNWTFVTLPSVSLAEARMVTLAVLLKDGVVNRVGDGHAGRQIRRRGRGAHVGKPAAETAPRCERNAQVNVVRNKVNDGVDPDGTGRATCWTLAQVSQST